MIECPACGFSANPASSFRCTVCGASLPRDDARPRGRQRSHTTRSWRRDLLFRRGARPVLIAPGKTCRVGRGPECELHIHSQRVSRLHAEIVWEGEDLVLRDLGSHNGTKLNGKAVGEAKLENGDELSFGPYRCLYKRLTGVGEAEAREIDAQLTAQLDADGAFAGTLEAFTLIEILQALEVQGRTGTLQLRATESGDGWIAVRDGRPVAASCGVVLGDEAVQELLRRERGTFAFRPELAEDLDENVIEDSLQALLVEAARQEDTLLTSRYRVAALGDLETEIVGPEDAERDISGEFDVRDPSEETFPGGDGFDI
ncbi:MAG: FHA domain-containing protein [Planctomycetota bacterium]